MTDEWWAALIRWLQRNGLILVIHKKGPPTLRRKVGGSIPGI